MSDLVKRLRHWSLERNLLEQELCREAADAIADLVAENERLRSALQAIADYPEFLDKHAVIALQNAARQALRAALPHP